MNTFLAKGDMRQLAGIKPNEHNKRQHIFFLHIKVNSRCLIAKQLIEYRSDEISDKIFL